MRQIWDGPANPQDQPGEATFLQFGEIDSGGLASSAGCLPAQEVRDARRSHGDRYLRPCVSSFGRGVRPSYSDHCQSKHLNGRRSRVSAKTRSSEQAERKAQQLRDSGDPLKRLQRQLDSKHKRESVTLVDAVAKCLNEMSTLAVRVTIYKQRRTRAKKLLRYAGAHGVHLLQEASTEFLTAWRQAWTESVCAPCFTLPVAADFALLMQPVVLNSTFATMTIYSFAGCK
jgi:hypothetical protein